jgi:hypothetical protein
MAEDREIVVLDVDEAPAVRGAGKANAALDSFEKRAATATQGASRSFEQAGEQIVRVTDRSRNSIERMVAAAEKKAAFAGVDRIGGLTAERDQLISRIAGDSQAVDRVRAAYSKLIETQRQADNSALLEKAIAASKQAEKATLGFDRALQKVNETARQNAIAEHNRLLDAAVRASRQAEKGAQDFQSALQRQNKLVEDGILALEKRARFAGKTGSEKLGLEEAEALKQFGNSAGSIDRIRAAFSHLRAEQDKTLSLGERIKAAIANPLQAASEGWDSFTSKLGVGGVVLGVTAAAVGVLGKALFDVTAAQGKAAEQTVNLADRLGITVNQAQDFANAADIAGVGIGGLDTGVKLLAAALEDQAGVGAKSAKALQTLGVATVDLKGNQRDLGIVFVESLEKLAKIENQSERVKRSNELLGKGGVVLQPLIKNLDQLLAVVQKLRTDPKLVQDLADADDKIGAMEKSWGRFKNILAARVGIPILDSILGVLDKIEEFNNKPASARNFGAFAPQFNAPEDPMRGFKVGASENRLERRRALEDHREGVRLQEQFAKREIATVDQVEAKLKDLKKTRDELENTLAGKQGEILGSAFRSKQAELQAAEKQIAILEVRKRNLEEAKNKPFESEKKAHEQLLEAQKAEFGGLASLIIQYRDLSKEIGVTEKARRELAAAFQLRVKTEVNKELRKNATETLKDLEEQNKLTRQYQEQQFKKDQQYGEETDRLRLETTKSQMAYQENLLEHAREVELRGVEMQLAVTTSQKVAAVAKSAAIEESYVLKGYALKASTLNLEQDLEFAAIEAEKNRAIEAETGKFKILEEMHLRYLENKVRREALYFAGPTTPEQDAERQAAVEKKLAALRVESTKRTAEAQVNIKASLEGQYDKRRDAVAERYAEKGRELTTDSEAKIAGIRDAATIKSRDLMISAQQEAFDRTRSAFEGILDQMLSRSRSFGDILKSILNAALLTPVKQFASAYVAALLTGSRVAYGPGGRATVTGGSGSVGGLAGLLGIGAITGGSGGFGVPIFGNGSITGGPGGTGGFAGPVVFGGGGTPTISRGGPLGNLMSIGGIGSQGNILSRLGNIGFGPKGGDFGGEVAGSYRGFGGVAGGAMLAGGIGLGLDGWRRGGLAGLGELTASGALIGLKFGGPVGALIGGAIGAGIGFVRLFIKGAEQKAIDKIKALYNVNISKDLATSIVGTAKQSFGGDLDLAIRSTQIRELIELYAMSTGQKWGFRPTQPALVSLEESGGSIFQNPAYRNGSMLPSLGGSIPSLSVAAPGPTTIVVQNVISGDDVGAYLDGRVVTTVARNPQVVQAATLSATSRNSGRREMAAAQFSPGLVTS